MLLPLLVFIGLAALFLFGLGDGDPSKLPSALIGKPVPKTNLPPIAELSQQRQAGAGPEQRDASRAKCRWSTSGRPGAYRVTTKCRSWSNCRTTSAFKLVGINYKDAADNARRFLNRYGNPFIAAGADSNGRTAIDWGVYGVPETFLIGRDGRIAYKLVGPITAANMKAVLEPEIEKALK